ncbi:4-amino-4-deoxychorismate lyase [Oceaniferula spumae]|uniref:branched-chain-amino-acid transaminase n=1 Tax=Oceaniferula spumae TaxID=2979115 RepID=A0AAT9FJ63_9BACT
MNEEKIVWFNGTLMGETEVHLSPFDLGVSVGLGVFETLSAYRGLAPTFPQHYERLVSSAAEMDLSVPDAEEIADAVESVIRANGLGEQRARVRISLGTGARDLGGHCSSADVQDYIIVTAIPQDDPKPMAELVLVPKRCNEHSAVTGIKSSSYANHVLSYRYARKAGADEGVMLNTSGNICECSMSNLFLVKDGKVLTPPLSSGCLPGVTRAVVMKLCQEESILVEEWDLSEDDLFTADEIFITSSAREVQPAKMVDTEMQCPGPLSKRIAEAYQRNIHNEA